MVAPIFDPEEVRKKSQALETGTPEQILAFAFETYPNIAISTAFGIEGCALIDMAVKLKPDVQVFTVDTDYLFAESIELRKRFEDKYHLAVKVFRPAITIEEQEKRHGPKLYVVNPDACCAIRKVEPTARAIAGLDAWIAGLRRDQSKTRSGTPILDLLAHQDGSPYVKVSPLVHWTRNDTWRYVMAHGVPYSPLLDQGYKSIGCWPCTRPVGEGEDERAGRWSGQQKTECGIHGVGKEQPHPDPAAPVPNVDKKSA